MTPLIDATEMYLRTVWELEEESITPIRARLVERLGLSAPAVSETVARLEQEGLMRVTADRTLELTDSGRDIAVHVMRKHRLAEVLLTDVIGLEWEHVHAEACRWEHVISDAVEQRLIEMLGSPTTCPHGNPIPGMGGGTDGGELITMAEAAKAGERATVRRISEKLQSDIDMMRFLRQNGLYPEVSVSLSVDDGRIVARIDGRSVPVDEQMAEHLYVTAQR